MRHHIFVRRIAYIVLNAQPTNVSRRFGHTLTPEDLDSLLPASDPEVGMHVARLQALMFNQRRLDIIAASAVTATTMATTTMTTTATTTARVSNRCGDDGHCDGGLDDVHMTNAEDAAAASDTAGGRGGEERSAHSDLSADRSAEWRRRRGGRTCPPDGARARNRRYRRLQQLAAEGVWFSDEAMKERDPWLWHEHVGRLEGGERPAPKATVEEVLLLLLHGVKYTSSFLSSLLLILVLPLPLCPPCPLPSLFVRGLYLSLCVALCCVRRFLLYFCFPSTRACFGRYSSVLS